MLTIPQIKLISMETDIYFNLPPQILILLTNCP